MSAAEKEACGPDIARLRFPLFPTSDSGFAALNTKLLAQTTVEGGGHPQDRGLKNQNVSRCDIFRSGEILNDLEKQQERSPRTEMPIGAGYAPIVQLPGGSWGADLSEVERAFNDLRATRVPARSMTRGRGGGPAPRNCYKCGQPGHIAKFCTKNTGRGGYPRGGTEQDAKVPEMQERSEKGEQRRNF